MVVGVSRGTDFAPVDRTDSVVTSSRAHAEVMVRMATTPIIVGRTRMGHLRESLAGDTLETPPEFTSLETGSHHGHQLGERRAERITHDRVGVMVEGCGFGVGDDQARRVAERELWQRRGRVDPE